jgi:hypothetical protein
MCPRRSLLPLALEWSISARAPVERTSIVACHYVRHCLMR